jgi:hypothetical protein
VRVLSDAKYGKAIDQLDIGKQKSHGIEVLDRPAIACRGLAGARWLVPIDCSGPWQQVDRAALGASFGERPVRQLSG